MDGSKILITGGAGFVGSNLTHYLLSNYSLKKIIIVDNLISSDPINIPVDNSNSAAIKAIGLLNPFFVINRKVPHGLRIRNFLINSKL